jgi:hypothetical protein
MPRIRYWIMALLLMFHPAQAQTPAPAFYEANVDRVIGAHTLTVAGVPSWQVTHPDSGFTVQGVMSGDLTSQYSASQAGDTFQLQAVPGNITERLQVGDWITVTVFPEITQGADAFQWRFQVGGKQFLDTNLRDMIDVQPMMTGQELTMAQAIDLNNDNLPDLVLIAGTEVHFYTTNFCPVAENPGRVMEHSDFVSGINDANNQARIYFIFAVDLDGNGFRDLLLFNRLSTAEVVYLRNATTNAGAPVRFDEPSTLNLNFLDNAVLQDAQLADVTHDGLPDVILFWERTLQVFPGTGVPAAPFLIPSGADPAYTFSVPYYMTAFEALDVIDEAGSAGPDGKLEILVTTLDPSRSPAFGRYIRWNGSGLEQVSTPFLIEAAANDSRRDCNLMMFPDNRGTGGPDLLFHELPGAFHRFLEYDGISGDFLNNGSSFLGGDEAFNQIPAMGVAGRSGLLYMGAEEPSDPPSIRYVYDVHDPTITEIGPPILLEQPLLPTDVLALADFDQNGDQDLLVIHKEDPAWEFHYLLENGRWALPTGLRMRLEGAADSSIYTFDDICLGGSATIMVELYLDPLEVPLVDSVWVDNLEITSDGDPEFPDVDAFEILTVDGHTYDGSPIQLFQGQALLVALAFSTEVERVTPFYSQIKCSWRTGNGAGGWCYWSEKRVLTGAAKRLDFSWAKVIDQIPNPRTELDFGTVCVHNTFDVADGCPEDPAADGCLADNQHALINNSAMPITLLDLVIEGGASRDGIIPFCIGEGLPFPVTLQAGEAYPFQVFFCPEPGAPASYPLSDGYRLRAVFEECGTFWNESLWNQPLKRLALAGENECECPVLGFDTMPGEMLEATRCYDQMADPFTACDINNPLRTELVIGAGNEGIEYLVDDLTFAWINPGTGLREPFPWPEAFCLQELSFTQQWIPLATPFPLRGGLKNISFLFQPEEAPGFPCGPTDVLLVAENVACGADPSGDGIWQADETPPWVPDEFLWPFSVCYDCDSTSVCLDLLDHTPYDAPSCGGLPGDGDVGDPVLFNDESTPGCNTILTYCFRFENTSRFSLEIQDWASEPVASMFTITGPDASLFRLQEPASGFPLIIPAYGEFELVVEYLPFTTVQAGVWQTAELTVVGGPGCPAQIEYQRTLSGFARCNLAYVEVRRGETLELFPGDSPWDLGTHCYEGPIDCNAPNTDGELFWTFQVINPIAMNGSPFTVEDVIPGDPVNLSLWRRDVLGDWVPFGDAAPYTLAQGEVLDLGLAGCWTCGCSGATLLDSLAILVPESRYDTPQYGSDEAIVMRLEAEIGCDGQVEIEEATVDLELCAMRPLLTDPCEAQYAADSAYVRLRNSCAIDLLIESVTLDPGLEEDFCVTILDNTVLAGVFSDNIHVAFRPGESGTTTTITGNLTIHLGAADGFSLPPSPLVVPISGTAIAPGAQSLTGPGLLFDMLTCADRLPADLLYSSNEHQILDLDLAMAACGGTLQWHHNVTGPGASQFVIEVLKDTVDADPGLPELRVIYWPLVSTPETDTASLELEFYQEGDPAFVVSALQIELVGINPGSVAVSANTDDLARLLEFDVHGLRLASQLACDVPAGSPDTLSLRNLCAVPALIGSVTLGRGAESPFCVEILSDTVQVTERPNLEIRFSPVYGMEAIETDIATVVFTDLLGNEDPETLLIPLQGSAQDVDPQFDFPPIPDRDFGAYCSIRPADDSDYTAYEGETRALGIRIANLEDSLRASIGFAAQDEENFFAGTFTNNLIVPGIEFSVTFCPVMGPARTCETGLLVNILQPNTDIVLEQLSLNLAGTAQGPAVLFADGPIPAWVACGLRPVNEPVCDDSYPGDDIRTIRLANHCRLDLQIESIAMESVNSVFCAELLDSQISDGSTNDHIRIRFSPSQPSVDTDFSDNLIINLVPLVVDSQVIPLQPHVIPILGTALAPELSCDTHFLLDTLSFGGLCPDRPAGDTTYESFAFGQEDLGFSLSCAEDGLLHWEAGITGTDAGQFFLDTLGLGIDGVGGEAEIAVIYCPEVGLPAAHQADLTVRIYDPANPLITLFQDAFVLRGTSYGDSSRITERFLLAGTVLGGLDLCPFRFDSLATGLDSLVLELSNSAAPVGILVITPEIVSIDFTADVELVAPPLELGGGQVDSLQVRITNLGVGEACRDTLYGELRLSLDWAACGNVYADTLRLPVRLFCLPPQLQLAGELVLPDDQCPFPVPVTSTDSLTIQCFGDSLLTVATLVRETSLAWQDMDQGWNVAWPADMAGSWLVPGDSLRFPVALVIQPGSDTAIDSTLHWVYDYACGAESDSLVYSLDFTRACTVNAPRLPGDAAIVVEGYWMAQPGQMPSETGAGMQELLLQHDPGTTLPIVIESMHLLRNGVMHDPGAWADTSFFATEFLQDEPGYLGNLLELNLQEPDDTLRLASPLSVGVESRLKGFWPDWHLYPPEGDLALDSLRLQVAWRSVFETEARTLDLAVPVFRRVDFPTPGVPPEIVFAHDCVDTLRGGILVEDLSGGSGMRAWLGLNPGSPFLMDGPTQPLAQVIRKQYKHILESTWALDSLAVPATGLAVDLLFPVPVSRNYALVDTLRVWTNHPASHWRFFGDPMPVRLAASNTPMIPRTGNGPVDLVFKDPACPVPSQTMNLDLLHWGCRALKAWVTAPPGPYRMLIGQAADCIVADTLQLVDTADSLALCLELVSDTQADLLDAWFGRFELTVEDGDTTRWVFPLDLEIHPCDVTLGLFIGNAPGENTQSLVSEPWGKEFELPFGVDVSAGEPGIGRVLGDVEVTIRKTLTVAGETVDSEVITAALGPDGQILMDTTLTTSRALGFDAAGRASVVLRIERTGNLDHPWILFANSPDSLVNGTDVQPFELSRNVVTPNGDGFNDEVCFLFQRGYDLSRMKVAVYSLSGVEVFRGAPTDEQTHLCWDGSGRSGEALLPGPYLYAVWIGSEVKYRGQVVVVK